MSTTKPAALKEIFDERQFWHIAQEASAVCPTLAELAATGHRSGGAAPAGFGPAHHPPASDHEQARPQDRKTQGLGRPSQGSGTCFHGPRAQGSEGTKTLKGVEVNAQHALVKKLEANAESASFDDLANILFDQALPADLAAYVRRVNALLV